MKKRILMLVMCCLLCLPSGAGADDMAFAPMGAWRVFCEGGLYGVQTLEGETVVPARFNGIEPFQGDLCVVERDLDGDDDLCGLWRLSTGEELLPCEYSWIDIADRVVLTSPPSDSEDPTIGRTRIFDPETGRVLLDTEETEEEFVPRIMHLGDGLHFVLYGFRRRQLITQDGTPLLEPFADVRARKESDGIIMTVSLDDGLYRYYDASERRWLEGAWQSGMPFVDGYAPVSDDGKSWYVIDETGAAVSPGYAEIAGIGGAVEYGRGLFAVRQDTAWYMIRVSSGAEPELMLEAIPCSNKPFYLGGQTFALPVTEGTLIFSAADHRRLMLEGISVRNYGEPGTSRTIRRGDKNGFLLDDLTVIEPVYDDCVPFLGDYGFVMMDGGWHPIDRKGVVDRSVSYPSVAVSTDGTYYAVEYDPNNVLCLSPELEPISHRSYVEHG